MTKRFWLLFLVLILVIGYGYWTYRKPLPLVKPDHSQVQLQINSPTANLSWPGYGQAAVALVGNAKIETHGSQTPSPTASIAKIISALCILQQKPLSPGQSGPLITLSGSDVDIYNNYVAQDGSVIPVSDGEQISEYQLLEAMMLPSANNAADSLADWAFGSLPAYASYANNWLQGQGLDQTHVGIDASGFSPTTTSTAGDLVKLGEIAMKQPILSQIVDQSSANIPAAGTIHNVNLLLGSNNIIGIKTGNNDQDNGAFLSASTKSVNGHDLTIITAIMDAPNLWQVMHDSASLVQSAQANFSDVSVASAGEVVGDYHLPWGGEVQAVTSQAVQLPVWRGSNLSATISLNSLKPGVYGLSAGNLKVNNSQLSGQQQINLKLSQPLSKPPLWWRFTHPFN